MAVYRSRLAREISHLQSNPIDGISTRPLSASDMSQLQAKIAGPPNTPFESGTFLLQINIPFQYPIEPPRVRFLTPIFHPNVSSSGDICLDILQVPPSGSWTSSSGLREILLAVRSMLLSNPPNTEMTVMPEISRLYEMEPNLFWREAQWRTKCDANVAYARVIVDQQHASSSLQSAKGKKIFHKGFVDDDGKRNGDGNGCAVEVESELGKRPLLVSNGPNCIPAIAACKRKRVD